MQFTKGKLHHISLILLKKITKPLSQSIDIMYLILKKHLQRISYQLCVNMGNMALTI